MRKLVLGLLLTAGICGNAMANQGKIVEKNDNKVQKAIKKIATVKDGGCSIYSKIDIYDSCGTKLSTTYTATTGSGSECNGAAMGLLFKNFYTTVPGCATPGPVVNKIENIN
ncbi:MAG: hypothetical protein JST62_07350 [Bacteroidetes bacterium]|nr:hypothetical protein [Bacteroidota bacterium]